MSPETDARARCASRGSNLLGGLRVVESKKVSGPSAPLSVSAENYQAYRAGSNVVFLDADVAKAFEDSQSVNQALRFLLDLAKRQLPPDRAA